MTDAAKRDARRRRIRTRVQAFVSACAVLLVVLPLALDLLELTLSAEQYAVVAGAVALITQAAAFVTRVMNAPAVNAFIERFLPWMATGYAEPAAGEVPAEDAQAVPQTE